MDPSTSGRDTDGSQRGSTGVLYVSVIGCGSSHTVAVLSEPLLRLELLDMPAVFDIASQSSLRERKTAE